MVLKINTIIGLANNEKYVLLNNTEYESKNYFLAMGVDETGNVIPTKVAILEEVIDNNELFINKVTDPDMIVRLTRILKNTLN